MLNERRSTRRRDAAMSRIGAATTIESIDREALLDLARAIDTLPAQQRIALSLFYLGGLTVTADQLREAPVPSLCGHPAGRLTDGKLPGIAADAGFVTLGGTLYDRQAAPPATVGNTVDIGDIDGDGIAEGVAVVACSPGGNLTELHAFAWAPGPRLIGRIPFEDGGANTGLWPSGVAYVAIVDRVIHLRGYGWQKDDCHACAALLIARSVTLGADGTFTTDRADHLGHTITMDGIGSAHAGISLEDVAASMNSPVAFSDPSGAGSPDSPCVYVAILGTDRISGTGGNDLLGALYVSNPAYRTERGVGPGSTVAEVESAYPGQITRRNNQYRNFDDLYVGSTRASGAAIRFVLDQATGTHVDEVISGSQPAVSLSEGCS